MPMSPRLLRPRQASSFDPRTIGGLELWMDGSDATSMGTTSSAVGGVTNNSPVKYWRDKVKTYSMSQTGADSVSPTFLTSAFGGRGGLYFDGGDHLVGPNISLASPVTYYMTIDVTGQTYPSGIRVVVPSTIQFRATAKASFGYGGTVPANTTVESAAVVVFAVTVNASGAMVARANDAAVYSGTAGTTGLDMSSAFGANNTNSQFGTMGSFGDFLLYAGVHNAATITRVTRALRAKYRIN